MQVSKDQLHMIMNVLGPLYKCLRVLTGVSEDQCLRPIGS